MSRSTAPLLAAGALSGVFALILGIVILGGGSSRSADAAAPGLRPGSVPEQYQQWVLKAGRMCPDTVGPAALAAQLDAESHWNPAARSSAGAQGIAQFMPTTWPSWGHDEDGNVDGPAADPALGSPLDPFDAIMAQGRFMCSLAETVKSYTQSGRAQGEPLDLALAAYNSGPGGVLSAHGIPHNGQTETYVARIRGLMSKYAAPQPLAPGSGQFGRQVVAAAQSQTGQPYVWGGGGITGPTGGGFDCSGLVMYALHQASHGQIVLQQHLADAQVREGQPVSGPTPGSQVPLEQLQPGDIIGFASPGSSRNHHIGIYAGNGAMVHAPDFGESVKTSPVTSSYWQQQTWTVRRFG